MSRWYQPAIVFFLLQSLGAFGGIDRVIYGSWEYKPGDKLTQALNLLQIAVSLLLFAEGVRRKRIRTGAAIALALVVFLFASAAWSFDPDTTIRRAVIYLFLVLGAIGIANVCDGETYMQLVVLTVTASAVASIALLIISPSDALMMSSETMATPEPAALCGVFSHKNVLGQVMVVGCLASLHGLRLGRRRLFNAAALIVCAGVTLMSMSATSFLVICTFCGVVGAMGLYRKGGMARMISLLTIIVCAPAGLVLALFPDAVLEMIGKDPTLTGRTELWIYVLQNIYQRPLLGWGMDAFWLSGNPNATAISQMLGWTVPQAHNVILEMLLQVGIIGTAFFLLVWIRVVVISFESLRTPARELAISSLINCGGMALVGITEGDILINPNQASVGAFFILGLMCERALRVAGLRKRPAMPQASSVGLGPSGSVRW